MSESKFSAIAFVRAVGSGRATISASSFARKRGTGKARASTKSRKTRRSGKGRTSTTSTLSSARSTVVNSEGDDGNIRFETIYPVSLPESFEEENPGFKDSRRKIRSGTAAFLSNMELGARATIYDDEEAEKLEEFLESLRKTKEAQERAQREEEEHRRQRRRGSELHSMSVTLDDKFKSRKIERKTRSKN